jgi:hypothetical protein
MYRCLRSHAHAYPGQGAKKWCKKSRNVILTDNYASNYRILMNEAPK